MKYGRVWSLLLLSGVAFGREKEVALYEEEVVKRHPLDYWGKYGVDVALAITGVADGDNRGHRKGSYLLDLGIKVESERAMGYEGGTFYVDFQRHHGGNLWKEVGSVVNLAYIDGPTFSQVSELWYKQVYGKGDFWFLIGKNDGSLYFDCAEHAILFQNGAYEAISSILIFPVYPEPAMGVVVGTKFMDWISVKGAVYDGSLVEGYPTGQRGIVGRFFDQLDRHAFLIGELDLDWWGRLKGRIGLGVWGNTSKFFKFDGGKQRGTAGFYAVMDQSVWMKDKREAGFFLQYGVANPEISVVDTVIAGGLSWKGVSACRSKDVLGAAVAWQGFSQEKSAGFTERAEIDCEVFYLIQATSWLTIQPDVQYIIHPGGGGNPSAFIGLVDVSIWL